MNISDQLIGLEGVDTVRVNKHADMHGQKATSVKVGLDDGRTVEGTFTTDTKDGFGGVVFSSVKDVVALMTAKINSVRKGTAE